MFSTLQDDVKILDDEVHPFQAGKSILVPSVEDYLLDSLPVSLC